MVGTNSKQMVDYLHIFFIVVICSLILYIFQLINLTKYNLEKLANKDNKFNSNENDSENDIYVFNKPIVGYKIEYRSRNSSL